VQPEVLALDVDELAAIQAFYLGVSTNPADAPLVLVMAPRTFHINFEVVRLALFHYSPKVILSG
jgi:hypothetical protein